MCRNCYYAAYNASPVRSAAIKASQAAYRAQPEHKAKAAAYRAQPGHKAQATAYMAAYRARLSPARKAQVTAYNATYRARPGHKAKAAAYMTAYHAKPEGGARIYSTMNGIPYEDVLLWFASADRTCWMCHQARADVLDHDHRTLVVRGWAHNGCNKAEGFVMSSSDPIAVAATLLQIALAA